MDRGWQRATRCSLSEQQKFRERNDKARNRREMLEQFRIHRQILYDLTIHYLECKDGFHARLAYLASLRDPVSEKYLHDKLSSLYGEAPVNEVLAKCHNELFERLLETRLALQEEDLIHYVETLPAGREENIQYCRELTESWIPPGAPEYLKVLFRSNQAALLELLQKKKTTVR
jgi:hypothetical protein